MRDYRYKIDFLHLVKKRNECGEYVDTWEPIKERIWASMEPLLGNEFFASLTTDNKVEVKFNMR